MTVWPSFRTLAAVSSLVALVACDRPDRAARVNPATIASTTPPDLGHLRTHPDSIVVHAHVIPGSSCVVLLVEGRRILETKCDVDAGATWKSPQPTEFRNALQAHLPSENPLRSLEFVADESLTVAAWREIEAHLPVSRPVLTTVRRAAGTLQLFTIADLHSATTCDQPVVANASCCQSFVGHPLVDADSMFSYDFETVPNDVKAMLGLKNELAVDRTNARLDEPNKSTRSPSRRSIQEARLAVARATIAGGLIGPGNAAARLFGGAVDAPQGVTTSQRPRDGARHSPTSALSSSPAEPMLAIKTRPQPYLPLPGLLSTLSCAGCGDRPAIAAVVQVALRHDGAMLVGWGAPPNSALVIPARRVPTPSTIRPDWEALERAVEPVLTPLARQRLPRVRLRLYLDERARIGDAADAFHVLDRWCTRMQGMGLPVQCESYLRRIELVKTWADLSTMTLNDLSARANPFGLTPK